LIATAPAVSGLQGLAARIDAALPQTQCTRCGYPDCAAYAQAIADGEAQINQCPPGGAEGVQRLAAITGHAALPLNPENGPEGPRMLAVIDEAWCIGCTLCIKACPTDAILGANKLMHTVITPHCTGCELCIPVCPVDCIQLELASGDATGWNAWSGAQAQHARLRYTAHRMRTEQPASVRTAPIADSAAPTSAAAGTPSHAPLDKQSVIAAALARARARRPD
jgi:electron transport complex protein RnfB